MKALFASATPIPDFAALQFEGNRDRFLQDVLSNRNNNAILDRWKALDLPDGWLVAGCVLQTVWNIRSGVSPEARIKDYDLLYFDRGDLSRETKQRVQVRVKGVLSDLGISVETKNQARVHFWYERFFGYPHPELRTTCEGIHRFLIPATGVGTRPTVAAFEVYAPNGLPLLYDGRLFPNPLTNHPSLFEEKARSYIARWPWLRIERNRLACVMDA